MTVIVTHNPGQERHLADAAAFVRTNGVGTVDHGDCASIFASATDCRAHADVEERCG